MTLRTNQCAAIHPATAARESRCAAAEGSLQSSATLKKQPQFGHHQPHINKQAHLCSPGVGPPRSPRLRLLLLPSRLQGCCAAIRRCSLQQLAGCGAAMCAWAGGHLSPQQPRLVGSLVLQQGGQTVGRSTGGKHGHWTGSSPKHAVAQLLAPPDGSQTPADTAATHRQQREVGSAGLQPPRLHILQSRRFCERRPLLRRGRLQQLQAHADATGLRQEGG